MRELVNVKGHGFIEVKGKRYDFSNQVSTTFDTAINHFLARIGLTGESAPTGNNLFAQPVNGFSLIGNNPEPNKFKLYDEIGFLSMSAFEVQGVDYFKTKLRGAAISSAGGTVRGGGFNIVTKNTKSPLTAVQLNRRKITLDVSTFYTLPVTTNWFYHYDNKSFYNFQTTGDVNKLEWDYETGEWGTHSVTTSGFTFSSNAQDIFTDGVNRLFAFSSTSNMRIYDFTTDTFSDETLSTSLSSTSNVRQFLGWDDVEGGLRCIRSSFLATSSDGFFIHPDGTVDLDTGTLPIPSQSWNPVLFEDEVIWSPYAADTVSGSVIPSDDSGFNSAGTIVNMYNDGLIQPGAQIAFMRFAPRNNNRFMFAEFNSTTPTSVVVHFCEKPRNYTTILSTSPIPVDLGDALVIEYTFTTGS